MINSLKIISFQIGDQVVAVNGKNVMKMRYSEVSTIFKIEIVQNTFVDGYTLYLPAALVKQ